MKNLRLHGIYLSIIGILCFQLWSKTAATRLAFEHVGEVLKNDSDVLKSDSEEEFYIIQKQYSTNPEKYGHFITFSKYVRDASKSAIDVVSNGVINITEGKKVNLLDVKDSLQILLYRLSSVADGVDSNILKSRSGLYKLLQNDSFWNNFKVNQMVYMQLLKNQIRFEEIQYLNYFMDKVSSRLEYSNDLGFRVAISPKKTTIIEGESFEADIYLTTYNLHGIKGVTYVVENKKLLVDEGVAHFSKIENTTGLKSFNAYAFMRNPLTGQSTTIMNVFEYHVLPKCSKNCQ